MKLPFLKYFIALMIFAGFYSATIAQVNTEKFRKYSTQKGFLFNTTFRLGYSSGNSEYLSVDGTFRTDYNGKVNNAFIVANYDYKQTESGKVENKGFVHLRGIHPFNKTLSGEAFLQQEFNEFLLLEDRKLAGAGLRFKLLDVESRDENDSLSGLFSHLGLGLMYEREIYRVGEVEKMTIKKEPVRFTSYLTFDWTISERINCWIVGYYQPNIKSIHDFRGIVETGVEVWVIKKIYLNFGLSYHYNNEPVGNVKNYDIVINNGFRLKIP